MSNKDIWKVVVMFCFAFFVVGLLGYAMVYLHLTQEQIQQQLQQWESNVLKIDMVIWIQIIVAVSVLFVVKVVKSIKASESNE
jgi:archaellum biogenesis protein FlaJ (TadC family)